MKKEAIRRWEKIDLLLINPPGTEMAGFTAPPLGLMYLASIAEHCGHSAQIVDGCIQGPEAIVEAIKEEPRHIGITCLTPKRHRAIEIARLASELSPNSVLILGGAHPSIMAHQIEKHYPFVDLICKGEGEKWLEGLLGGWWTEEQYNNLDNIPFPAYHLVDLDRYPSGGRKGPMINVIFSRGCPAHCNFCSSWWIWKKYRVRSPENMADELEWLHTKGYRNIGFADDCMTVDRGKVLGLCDEILRRDLDIGFHITTRSDCVDPEMLAMLKRAGCWRISLGIESGSPTILRNIHKDNEIQTNESAIRACREAKIECVALLMIGNPGETDETIGETRVFLKRTKPHKFGCAGGVWLLPGTAIYNHAKRKGFIDDDFWLGPEPLKVYTLEASKRQLAHWTRKVYSANRWLWFRHIVRMILEALKLYRGKNP